jgi:hypothetical protein
LDQQSANIVLPTFVADAAKVIAHAGELFPFLTQRVELARIAKAGKRTRTTGGLTNPMARRASVPVHRPLVLRPDQLQAAIDASWSRRDRWSAFQSVVRLASEFDANDGALPVLLRGYVNQNGLQPYLDAATRDPRLWTQLGLAADHATFLAFLVHYVETHPDTRSATEMLFLLDKIVQANLDALETLLDSDPVTSLDVTRQSNPAAYRAIVTNRDHYRDELGLRRIATRAALRRRYDETRIDLLKTILTTTPRGYRADDARFLLGAVYWEFGQIADSVDAWRGLVRDPDATYSETITALIHALDGALDTKEIGRILNREHGRWVSVSFDRLSRFGCRFDSY